MQTFRDVLVQVKGIWSRLDGGQRLVVTAVLGATIAGLGGIVWFAGQPGHEAATAKTNDGAMLAERAPGRSGPVDAGASRIEDAETREFKLDAASRAEAITAIGALDGVIAVNVTAGRPSRPFREVDHEGRASASVVLRLEPGALFDPLARSAASLAAAQLMVPLENIDVLSASGNQRWRYDPGREAGGGSSEFLHMQRSLGEQRTRLAQERLDQLWPGKTSVSVNLELDATWEVTSQKVLPEEALVKSETRDTSDTSSSKTADSEGRSTSRVQKREREFVTDIGERSTGKMAPEVKRLTVAVLYDRSLEQTPGFVVDDLVRAVKAIVGWDPARDQPEAFTTLAGDFAPDPAAMATAGPGIAEVLLQWGPTIGPILGVLIVVMFLRGLFQRARSPAQAAAAAAVTEVKEEDQSPEAQQQRLRREIEQSIANDPAALAKMLESWLTEQKA